MLPPFALFCSCARRASTAPATFFFFLTMAEERERERESPQAPPHPTRQPHPKGRCGHIAHRTDWHTVTDIYHTIPYTTRLPTSRVKLRGACMHVRAFKIYAFFYGGFVSLQKPRSLVISHSQFFVFCQIIVFACQANLTTLTRAW